MSEAEPLVQGARHAVAPAGIVATAWPRIAATCNNIGWRFDPWQAATGRLILSRKADGNWASNLSILSIPRQVGKSYLLGCIIFALCLLNPKLRVIWTSHHTATTEEMYEAMKELAQHKRVSPHIVKCIALQGSRWRIQFRNGSRIDFGARSQGFGRGKAKVGVLVLDEFQHITSRALANLAPTTNTAVNPLILCAGTPPGPEASGEAFTMRRLAALEGLSDDTLYVEFSADPDADADDRKQWAKANPSFPRRTGERAFLLLRKMLDEADFRREALGIWDASDVGVFDANRWGDLKDAESVIEGPVLLGLAVAQDHSWACISASGKRADGLLHVQVVEYQPGTRWAIEKLKEHAGKRRQVALRPTSPAGALITDLENAGVKLLKVTGTEYAQACGAFFKNYREAGLRHLGQRELDVSVHAAKKRSVGDAWMFDAKADIEISPLESGVLATHAASLGPPTNAARGRVIALA